MSDNSSSSSGIGLGGAVFLIFLTLKLIEVEPVAHWSWWWVCSPLLIGPVIVLTFFAVVGGGVGIFGIFSAISSWSSRRRRMRAMLDDDE